MRKITKETWAYAAGYVDGEGCIRIDQYTLRIEIASCYPATLKWLAESFGGRFAVKAEASGAYRRAYRWNINGKHAGEFLKGILPYSMEKKTQVKLGLQFLETVDKSEKAEIAAQLKALKKVIFYEKNIAN